MRRLEMTAYDGWRGGSRTLPEAPGSALIRLKQAVLPQASGDAFQRRRVTVLANSLQYLLYRAVGPGVELPGSFALQRMRNVARGSVEPDRRLLRIEGLLELRGQHADPRDALFVEIVEVMGRA